FVLRPGRDVGKRGPGPGARGLSPEQRMLTRVPLRLASLRLAIRVVQGGHQLRAVAPEGIARAGVDQRLDHPLVAEPEVDPLAQLYERATGPAGLPPREDRLDRAFAHVLDRAEAKADALVAHHGELEARLVHVGGEDLEPQLARLVDVAHHGVAV